MCIACGRLFNLNKSSSLCIQCIYKAIQYANEVDLKRMTHKQQQQQNEKKKTYILHTNDHIHNDTVQYTEPIFKARFYCALLLLK